MSFTVIEIESSLAGLVIGRGGAKITAIERTSGAVVKVINGKTNSTRVVKIIGNEQAQSLAYDLVLDATGGKMVQSEKTAAQQPVTGKPYRTRRAQSPVETINITDEQWAEIDRENELVKRDHDALLPEIIKEFYVEHEEVTAMSEQDADAFRLEKNNIMVNYVVDVESKNDNVTPAAVLPPIPKAVRTFQHAFHGYPEIMRMISKQNFAEPSPVQCQAWPCIMSGHDLIAIAQTGTGKTLAYILPAMINLIRQPVPIKDRIGPYVLILGPTRELILQIEEEIKKYIFGEISVQSVYGGSINADVQAKRLINEKPDIVVATPGRLNDLVNQKAVVLEHITYLVLDEADRMLDMGFKSQIELALRHIRYDRQTVLISATWPDSVKALARLYTNNPIQIQVGSVDLTTVNTVNQTIIVLCESKKQHWLDNFIFNMSKKDRVIIFMRKKKTVEEQYHRYRRQNVSCGYLVLIIIYQLTQPNTYN